MNSTTTSPSTRSLDQIGSDESSVQNFVAKNKVTIFVAIVAIIAIFIGIGFAKMYADKSKSTYNSKIYTFETTIMKDYLAKPAAPNAGKLLLDGLQQLRFEMGNYSGLFPLILKASDALMTNSHMPEARELLVAGEQLASDDYAKYLIMSRQAVVFEDLGEDAQAIEVLKKMTSQKAPIFEGKTYLDLGRLYLKMGDIEKAKTSLNYVVEKAKDETEFVKIAQLYLSKL